MAPTTRSSLLQRLRGGEAGPWEEFARLYLPFLSRAAEGLGLRGQDVDELAQATLTDLFRGRETFAYDRDRGRFRDYLRKALLARLFKQRRQAERAGTPTDPLPEPARDEWEQRWEEEYRRHVLRAALDRVRAEVEPKTFQAFQLYALERADARAVARFLEMSASAVYTSKSRVLERLRAAVRELTEE
jgi:RNA polymerase sigma factor (sigma-70 family)